MHAGKGCLGWWVIHRLGGEFPETNSAGSGGGGVESLKADALPQRECVCVLGEGEGDGNTSEVGQGGNRSSAAQHLCVGEKQVIDGEALSARFARGERRGAANAENGCRSVISGKGTDSGDGVTKYLIP